MLRIPSFGIWLLAVSGMAIYFCTPTWTAENRHWTMREGDYGATLFSSMNPPQGSSQIPFEDAVPKESCTLMLAPFSMSSCTIASLPAQAAKDRMCSPEERNNQGV